MSRSEDRDRSPEAIRRVFPRSASTSGSGGSTSDCPSEAAAQFGVHFTTVMNWEHQDRKPGPRFMPGVIRFLGYNPLPPGGTFGEQLIAHRKARGMTRIMFAAELGVHPTTLGRWENGKARPRCGIVPISLDLTERD